MDFALILIAIAGLVWGGFLMLRGGLLAGCLLVMLAGSCFGYPFFNLPTSPIPLTADRCLLVILLIQFAIYRRWGWTAGRPLGKTELVLGLFIGLLLVSTFLHDWRATRFLPASQLLFYYLMPLAMYVVAREAAPSGRAIGWMFGALAAFGLYLALTAIAETHQVWSLVMPQYIASVGYKEFFGRGRGPFLNPAGSGIFQTACLTSTLMAWPWLNRWGRLALVGLLPVLAWGIYCTLTRSVWMGAAAGLFIVFGLTVPRGWRLVVVGGTLAASLLLVGLNWDRLTVFKRDKDLSVEEMAESARLRPILAEVAWQMFLDRPVFGFGFGQYLPESRPYLSDRSTDLPLERARPYIQHNVFLGLLTETGLVGLGLFVLLLALWTRQAWRLWRCDEAPLWERQCGLLFLAMVGIYVPNGMFHNLTPIPMVNMLVFFLAGVTTGLAPNSASETLSSAANRRFRLVSASTTGRQEIGGLT